MSEVDRILDDHAAAGRRFTAAGIESFALDAGDGAAVVLMHGVPASSYLYRKVVPALAARGLRGVAFDLPGLGLAERPADADYTWTGLGRWAVAAVDALGLGELHLGREGAIVRELVPEGAFHTLPGKHFFPEEQAPALAERIAAFV